MGYSPWGCKELNTTEVTDHTNRYPFSFLFNLCLSNFLFPVSVLFIYFYYFEAIKYNFKPIYQLSHYFHFLQCMLFQILNLLVCSSRFSLICSGTGVFRLILKSDQWGLLLFLSVPLFSSLVSQAFEVTSVQSPRFSSPQLGVQWVLWHLRMKTDAATDSVRV